MWRHTSAEERGRRCGKEGGRRCGVRGGRGVVWEEEGVWCEEGGVWCGRKEECGVGGKEV